MNIEDRRMQITGGTRKSAARFRSLLRRLSQRLSESAQNWGSRRTALCPAAEADIVHLRWESAVEPNRNLTASQSSSGEFWPDDQELPTDGCGGKDRRGSTSPDEETVTIQV